MDDAVRDYVDAIAPEHRPLFDRLQRLILEAHPDAAVVLSYQMPTYKVGRHRLFLGVWRHGVSIYGWQEGRDVGFTARPPRPQNEQGHHPAATRGRRGDPRRRAPRPGAGRPRRLTG
jgi:hypothetical protein